MSLLTKVKKTLEAAQAQWNEPETFTKGDDFQSFVLNTFFPESQYTLIHRTANYKTNQERFELSTLDPDFKFQCKENGQIFWVEAKFRQTLFKGAATICTQGKIRQYHKVSEQCPLLIAVGIGGTATKPESVSLVPFKVAPYPQIYSKVLKSYSVNLGKAISCVEIKKLCSGI